MHTVTKRTGKDGTSLRIRLLHGSSILAVAAVLGAGVSHAQSLAALRAAQGLAAAANTKAAAAAPQAGQSSGMISAAQRAMMYATQAQQTFNLAVQAQQAAQAAARQISPTVPNGLVFGGLNPVANPVPAAQDPTGLNTWQGANAPTQTTGTGGAVTVTVQQTQSRAVLDWQTFNVGSNTTLVFDQAQNGVAQTGWVALNRVVGELNPLTGLRQANMTAPTQILGQIKAPGTVLILDQNGVIFGANSQINTNSLITSSLEIGQALNANGDPLTIAQRDTTFLDFGLLAYTNNTSSGAQLYGAFQSMGIGHNAYDTTFEGAITVDAGASITAGDQGFILFASPQITNSGHLTATDGQVSLAAGRQIFFNTSNGTNTPLNNPNIRGIVVSTTSIDSTSGPTDDFTTGSYVNNTATGIIESDRGYLSLDAPLNGATINAGVLSSTTSVSRNGFIEISGGDINLTGTSDLQITPDTIAETIPQGASSALNFQTSQVQVGTADSRIEIDGSGGTGVPGAMIYAPSGNITIGSAAGAPTLQDSSAAGSSRIWVGSGATIDASGLTDVTVSGASVAIKIAPVTGNDLANDPNYKNSFLNGATIYVDPRLSGVRSDGVAWIGSPLVSAESYYQQVGVSVQQLMTKGGNVALGTQSYAAGSNTATAPDVIVNPGATIDISGGWVDYTAALVQTTNLVSVGGSIVNVGQANPNDAYLGILTGYVENQPRWGYTQTFANPLLSGAVMEGAYSEGRDAGSLVITSSSVVLDGSIFADAYAGQEQKILAQIGTGTSGVYGDQRNVQGASSQLPVGGFLFIDAVGQDINSNFTGGGDISIVGDGDLPTIPPTLTYGQSVSVNANGQLVAAPARSGTAVLPTQLQDTIYLSADALSGMGLGQLSLYTSGQIRDEAGTTLTLSPGGVFAGLAGRAITIDGSIVAPSGKINLQTVDVGFGSVFVPESAQLGSFDVNVNGTLSTAGRWVNDSNSTPGTFLGTAYTSGGSISLTAAPRITLYAEETPLPSGDPSTNIDISGSIFLNQGSLVNVSGGGYESPTEALTLTAKGGNLSLVDQTTYFQLGSKFDAGGVPGFRVTTSTLENVTYVPINPSQINAQVALNGTILAAGFGGGGTFSLTTPAFTFGSGPVTTGTALPMSFFSTAGFANYNITSYGTDLIANTFTNGLGGYNAVLGIQTLTVGAGQTLSLAQPYFVSPLLTGSVSELDALRGLQTGGNLYSILTPTVPTDAWDQKSVNLTLGGTLELDVAKGGTVLGAAGSSLTVAGLSNAGTILIHGGTINESQLFPKIDTGSNVIEVSSLSQVFSTNPDGSIDENAFNAFGIADPNVPGQLATNAYVASNYSIVLLGDLAAGVGVSLAQGSVTNLSGEAIVNPRAIMVGQGSLTPVLDGKVISGGTLETQPYQLTSANLFKAPYGNSDYSSENPQAVVVDNVLNAAAGATIDLQGVQTTFTRLSSDGYAPTSVWSDGGMLSLGNGGTITGATIRAQGGAPNALGGELVVLNPTISQSNPATPGFDVISAQMIEKSGFDTFVAEGTLTTSGNVNLTLGRGFFLVSEPYFQGTSVANTADLNAFAPVISATGNLTIDAPYILLGSSVQSVSTPLVGTPGSSHVTLSASDIDVQGAVLFDQSISQVNLDATQALRLTGVEPPQQSGSTPVYTLDGQLLVNGNLTVKAGQVYPTTGSTFLIASAAANGKIEVDPESSTPPPTPYSAGGSLTIQAANIIQDGVIRVPLGTLTLGSDTALQITSSGVTTTFAPATKSLTVGAGSVTSVSADGLVIPYGTTTDQTEWFFTPTNANQLTAPPAGVLRMAGASVNLETGATVDLKGGGDVYAYEFIPGPGGSHDLLSQFNSDPFSSNNGYQYPNGQQVYAIVPGLSNQSVASYDPIYSTNYGSLYGASGAGMSVYLSGGPNLAAGWYTLLPAQYALLPGGMRVVVDSNSGTPVPGANGLLKDGTDVVSGYFGVAGTVSYQSTWVNFDVQSQSVFKEFSDIALTYGNSTFAALAQHNGTVTPRLAIDAGQLVLQPEKALSINATFDTAPASGGRGSEVDISGNAFDIVSSTSSGGPVPGAIVLTASSLDDLNAASLLIGGTRTDNADGTTTLNVTSKSITVENDSSDSLTAPEILLAVDGSGSSITINKGASIVATGTNSSTLTGNYIVKGVAQGETAQGAILRVSTGPQRLVTRSNEQTVKTAPVLAVDAGAVVQGNSVVLDSSGDASIASNAKIKATDLALDASSVTFAPKAIKGATGLVITPGLQSLLANAQQLDIAAEGGIAFVGGSYTFGNVTFDAQSVSAINNGTVTIKAGDLALQNSVADSGACGAGSAPACGTGSLTIDAAQITFGSGTLRTYGFGTAVSLASTGGIYYDGTGAFNVGPAALSIDTPFIADVTLTLTPGQSALVPSLAIATTGALTITDTSSSKLTAAGTPGASLLLNANDILISGATLRATAGTLGLTASQSVTIENSATLETPGYSRTFGDSADSQTISAPGGLLELAALNGNIDVASGTTLSVGGGAGKAGALELIAGNGTVTLAGTLDANAPQGGGSFLINTGGAFDLSNFVSTQASQFGGGIQIQSAEGDLALAAGQTLTSASVLLDADGGTVSIAGTIDTSGINGGNISLYGANGVSLASTAVLEAEAKGYGGTDARQATGGTVEIGTAGTGKLNVAQGANINVSALQQGDRMVPQVNNGTTYYTFVPADQGGEVHFRAPVIQTAGGDSVNVFVDGTVTGASAVVVEGYKQFNLATIASNPNFVGVTINAQGQAVLDTSATGAGGQANFLADNAAGTLVNFVQNFNISSAYGQFAGLVSRSNFHAQPGTELDYTGDIVLQSNWNLGAGTVNVQGAVNAGLMAAVPNSPGQYYVLPGADAQVFANFTTMTYRTDGGAVTGEPGILTLKAGGTLDLKGSITDGFFTFRDQTDPSYLNEALGGGNQIYSPYLTPNCQGSCASIGAYQSGTTLPASYVSIQLPGNGQLSGLLNNPIPYNAAANTPAALGAGVNGAGDPIGSAELFPLLGNQTPVGSWSYRLIGGADLKSADPLRVNPASGGSVVVEGTNSYTYSATPGSSSFNNSLLMQVGSTFTSAADWLQAFLSQNPSLSSSSFTNIDFSAAPSTAQATLLALAQSFFAKHPGKFTFTQNGKKITGVNTTVALAADFFSTINFGAVDSSYKPPKATIAKAPTTATYNTLVRTGTGSIAVAAAGDINLQNGAPTYLTLSGKPEPVSKGGVQVGGTAIYTAGHLAVVGMQTIKDALTGQSFTINPGPYASAGDVFSQPLPDGYRYGAGGTPDVPGAGYSGILIANSVYADGGGNVSLDANGNVLGRSNLWQSARLSTYYDSSNSFGYGWIGNSDQPWRTGIVGDITNIQVNPQLFGSGVGTLGGGSISVSANGTISDLNLIATDSAVTANVTTPSAVASTRALWTLGGGDVSETARGDILGGRIDVAQGTGSVTAYGAIAADGSVVTEPFGSPVIDDFWVRLTDATVSIQAAQGIDLRGITALGVQGASQAVQQNLDGFGFYSPDAGVSVVADGAVSVANAGPGVVTPSGDISTSYTSTAVYPGSFEAVSLTGNVDITTKQLANNQAAAVLLMPSPTGELNIFAAANIEPTTIAMEDADPGLLPGVFSAFEANTTQGVVNGVSFLFPAVLPNTTQVELQDMHNQNITHTGDTQPNHVYAGGSIDNMILSVPKQTRVEAGLDLVNMMFFGQNLSASDITRVVAGRDITATTTLVSPYLCCNAQGQIYQGQELSALQGNTFIVGGPGSLFLEAGRDAGPFLNSAVTNGFATVGSQDVPTGTSTYGGGILAVGNNWNPWLAQQSANLFVLFGVGDGVNYNGFRDYYIDPANLANLPSSLFAQVKNSAGVDVADRSQPIYGPILVQWMQANAKAQLIAAYGTTNVTYQQAYNVFATLPALTQRVFLIGNVYFNELEQASIPSSPSYKEYSRGYAAVNELFPSSYGYTQNGLAGGGNGASKTVQTGNLDLRLSTIQTDWGGNIFILGPGGEVLAGSTVATSAQAARHAYIGGALFSGLATNEPLPAAIQSIPSGYEGILTLRGGSINTFTDADFLINQSRLFTEDGGNIVMWSSNGSLNAGQGPKTSVDFPPIVVQTDDDLYSQVDSAGGVTGAGIAAFQPAPGIAAPDVFLLAPRGTVDAGDAGVRVAGNLFIAAFTVANATNFSVSGSSFGIPTGSIVSVGVESGASAASAAVAQAAQSAAGSSSNNNVPSIITVDVLGFYGDSSSSDEDEKKKKKK